MQLTKERARSPVIEAGTCSPSSGWDAERREETFTVACHGKWVQGKGHTPSYTLHLTKIEMLVTISSWLEILHRRERDEAKKKAAQP